jgi:hypothetical protein
MTQFTCKGVNQINNRISLNMTFTFTIPDNLWCWVKLLISIKRAMNSSRLELLWLVWDQSRSKYYLRTKFQDGIDKPQKWRNVCYHPAHLQQSDFLILVLYDYHTSNHLSVCHKPTSLSPINCQSVDNFCIIINTLINHHDPIYLWRCQTDQ